VTLHTWLPDVRVASDDSVSKLHAYLESILYGKLNTEATLNSSNAFKSIL